MRAVLSPYDPTWATSFDRIEAGLREALGDDALAVEHVGSTAVPGLSAKPLVDMLLVVTDSTDESMYGEPLRHARFEFHLREPWKKVPQQPGRTRHRPELPRGVEAGGAGVMTDPITLLEGRYRVEREIGEETYTTPWATIASATLTKPAMFAPFT